MQGGCGQLVAPATNPRPPVEVLLILQGLSWHSHFARERGGERGREGGEENNLQIQVSRLLAEHRPIL